eukprot:GILK01001316.1.p1 GENE.GILK01001316.1~~GILK01001316.1.p1  ORF type:complete len:399 (-),score=72.44 GILK01001316.1:202-1398(-)
MQRQSQEADDLSIADPFAVLDGDGLDFLWTVLSEPDSSNVTSPNSDSLHSPGVSTPGSTQSSDHSDVAKQQRLKRMSKLKEKRKRTVDADADSDDEEVKKKQRLLRNRESAQQSRNKKKAYVDELESKVRELSTANSEMAERLRKQEEELEKLRQQAQEREKSTFPFSPMGPMVFSAFAPGQVQPGNGMHYPPMYGPFMGPYMPYVWPASKKNSQFYPTDAAAHQQQQQQMMQQPSLFPEPEQQQQNDDDNLFMSPKLIESVNTPSSMDVSRYSFAEPAVLASFLVILFSLPLERIVSMIYSCMMQFKIYRLMSLLAPILMMTVLNYFLNRPPMLSCRKSYRGRSRLGSLCSILDSLNLSNILSVLHGVGSHRHHHQRRGRPHGGGRGNHGGPCRWFR